VPILLPSILASARLRRDQHPGQTGEVGCASLVAGEARKGQACALRLRSEQLSTTNHLSSPLRSHCPFNSVRQAHVTRTAPVSEGRDHPPLYSIINAHLKHSPHITLYPSRSIPAATERCERCSGNSPSASATPPSDVRALHRADHCTPQPPCDRTLNFPLSTLSALASSHLISVLAPEFQGSTT
jgi:hypothetical protein